MCNSEISNNFNFIHFKLIFNNNIILEIIYSYFLYLNLYPYIIIKNNIILY